MVTHNWDKYDQEALEFYKWEQFCHINNVDKSDNVNYIPKCYACKGTGNKFDPITFEINGRCYVCGGSGYKSLKPKFQDSEIREVVQKLGEEKVKELIREYKQRKK